MYALIISQFAADFFNKLIKNRISDQVESTAKHKYNTASQNLYILVNENEFVMNILLLIKSSYLQEII